MKTYLIQNIPPNDRGYCVVSYALFIALTLVIIWVLAYFVILA